MLWLFPFLRSFAETFSIPFASISNVTSIWGTPLIALFIPFNLNSPINLLSFANLLSPCNTFISTLVWKFAAVVNIWLYFVGIVEFLPISLVDTPPIVSIERDNGVTSNNKTSFNPGSPLNFPPWIAAPNATHSSGFKLLFGSFPVICFTFSWTAFILVEPPTNNIFSSSLANTPASFSAFLTGITVLSTKSYVNSSNFALVRVISICFGPSFPTAINGKFILVDIALESSFLAFSASSLTLWSATTSFDKSIPSIFLNSSIK